MRLALGLLLLATSTQAQWKIQQSNTTADLRGIHSLGNGIAWASGSKGTVLRTTDNGTSWQPCTIPPGAEALDFRGIQAFDAKTAIIMSSGKGDLSRLYKTTDACKTWKLLLSNPYTPEGFFDAILFIDPQHGILFGDPSPGSMNAPVEYSGNFRIRVTADGGNIWGPVSSPDLGYPGNGLHALPGESAFAASNSSIAVFGNRFWFATSAGRISSRLLWEGESANESTFLSFYCAGNVDPTSHECGQPWTDFENTSVPLIHDSSASGIFSLAFRTAAVGIATGGDYLKPSQAEATAAFTQDAGRHWTASLQPPNGYRSAVAYSPATKTWITVGPNGTDISTDDGRNWHPLRPKQGEAADADQHWNALSLPFVVGPHGRIGLLKPEALKP